MDAALAQVHHFLVITFVLTHSRDRPEAENQHEILLQDVPDGGRRIEDRCFPLPVGALEGNIPKFGEVGRGSQMFITRTICNL